MVTERFVIEGEIVYKEITTITPLTNGGWKTTVEKGPSYKYEDWLRLMLEDFQSDLKVLPAFPPSIGRICGMAKIGTATVMVTEHPPVMRDLQGDFGNGTRLYKLAFPWIIMIQRFVGAANDGTPHLYYSNTPVVTGDEPLHKTNLPNVYDDGHMCWGGGSVSSSLPLNMHMAEIWKHIWASQFNKHEISCHWNPSTKLEGHPQSFEEWEKMSAANPNFILKINWRPLDKTLRQKVKEMLG